MKIFFRKFDKQDAGEIDCWDVQRVSKSYEISTSFFGSHHSPFIYYCMCACNARKTVLFQRKEMTFGFFFYLTNTS